LEAARLAVQASLDAVTERAYALADRIQSDAVNSAASSAPGRG